MAQGITRRRWLAGAGGAAAATVVAPQALAQGLTSARRAPVLRAGRFREGVMSGDPASNGITLWTRVANLERSGSVRLEVARDKSFRRVVASKTIATSEALGGSVKARVTGLAAYEQYYYRFETQTSDSDVGRFRTALPKGSRQPVSFAFYSCQDYTHGYYNAHEVLADEDVDFVVVLGDYFYAETYQTLGDGTGTAVRADKIGRYRYPGVLRVATTLDDYRRKYELYRSDKALRASQANAATVVIWDDHEAQNDYAGGAGSTGGLPPDERYSTKRRNAAYRAWFEAMPTYGAGSRDRIYRQLPFGSTVDLFMLDQRQYRQDQPCNDAIGQPACPGYDDPRTLLGATQLAWLKRGLASSRAAWKVIGNEVMVMPVRLTGNAIATFDSWDGYPREREDLLQYLKASNIRDVVFVTGDIHAFVAGDVRTTTGTGDPVALEFVGGSITSRGFGEQDLPLGGGQVLPGNDQNPKTAPAILDALRGINTWVEQADLDKHGFGLVRATPDNLDVTFKRVTTIKRKSKATEPEAGYRFRVQRGQRSIKGTVPRPA